MYTVFSCVHDRIASDPFCRPMPEALNPPNGSSYAPYGEVTFTPTDPASNAFATLKALLISVVNTDA